MKVIQRKDWLFCSEAPEVSSMENVQRLEQCQFVGHKHMVFEKVCPLL